MAARGTRADDPPGHDALGPDAPEAPRLGAVIESLGSGILEPLVAPGGLDVAVAGTVIFDRHDEQPVERGDLVLAVGVTADERYAIDLVARAGAAGATAIVFKPGTVPPPLVDAARTAGVALLAAPRDLAWGQLHTLVRTAVTTAGGRSMVGAVPMGDLFALADAVAAMVGGPVTIEDPQSTVLAYSNLDEAIDEPRRRTILGRRVPRDWVSRLEAAGVFRMLWSTRAVVRYEDPDEPDFRPRLAVAIRAGGDILGSIWVAEVAQPLGPDAEKALLEVADIAALHMIRHRVADDLERRQRSDVLRAALEGRMAPELAAPGLGFDPHAPLTVAAFSIRPSEDSGVALLAERAARIVALHCEAFRRQAACVAVGSTIYALLPETGGDADGMRHRLRRFAGDLATHARSTLGVPVYGAIGSTVPDLRELPVSRREADRVLQVLARRGEPEAAAVEDVRAHTVLLDLREVAHAEPQLLLGKVRELVEYDRRKQSVYVETLRAYLDAFGNIPEAAAAIHVHPNTFRYRLRRLLEVSGIDLDDPDERLVVELQLRLVADH